MPCHSLVLDPTPIFLSCRSAHVHLYLFLLLQVPRLGYRWDSCVPAVTVRRVMREQSFRVIMLVARR